jgi:hypothetical protein
MQSPAAKGRHYRNMRLAIFFNEGIRIGEVANYSGREIRTFPRRDYRLGYLAGWNGGSF